MDVVDNENMRNRDFELRIYTCYGQAANGKIFKS